MNPLQLALQQLINNTQYPHHFHTEYRPTSTYCGVWVIGHNGQKFCTLIHNGIEIQVGNQTNNVVQNLPNGFNYRKRHRNNQHAIFGFTIPMLHANQQFFQGLLIARYHDHPGLP